MAQPAPTPFAVDSDITPLQGRYFESVTQNVSDPKLRTQLYDKVRATFGGIQQARDIQRAKAQEEEERTLSLELRRAQLDNSRMELGLARDRVRQQQEATAKAQEFNTALEDFQNYELPGLGAEEARSRVNLLGSQYSDVIAAVPAAKAKIDLSTVRQFHQSYWQNQSRQNQEFLPSPWPQQLRQRQLPSQLEISF